MIGPVLSALNTMQIAMEAQQRYIDRQYDVHAGDDDLCPDETPCERCTLLMANGAEQARVFDAALASLPTGLRWWFLTLERVRWAWGWIVDAVTFRWLPRRKEGPTR